MSNDFLRWLDQGRGITSSPSRGNLSYADPKFGKRKKSSDGGQFDWQGKLLKDLPKSMGSTYEAKFNTLASQIGVPKEQVNAFKTFIDAQEYGAKTHTQHVRDSDIKQAKRYGEGARNILREREQREKQAEAERLAKLAEQQRLQKTIKGWQGLPGMNIGVQGTGRSNRAMDSLTQPKKPEPKFFQDIKKALTGENHGIEPTKQSNLHFGDSDSRTTIRPPENVERFGGRVINSVTLGLPEEALKHRLKKNPNDEELQAEFERIYGGEMAWHDYVADILGYLPPGLAGVKAARAAGVGAKGLTKGISKHNAKELAKEGTVVGGAMGLSEVGIREALNPEDYSALDNVAHVGINAAAGAVLDPVIGLALPAFKHLSQKAMKDMLGPQSEILSQLVRNEVKASGIDIGTLDPSFNTGGLPEGRADRILRGLEPQAQGRMHNADFPGIEPRPIPPQRAVVGQPQPGQNLHPDSSVDEVLTYTRNPENPIREEDIPVIYSKLQELETRKEQLTDEGSREYFTKHMELRKSDPEYAELNDRTYEDETKLKDAVNKFTEWGEVQKIQNDFKPANRPAYYKFNIPKDAKGFSLQDFRDVPKRFRSADHHADDIYKAADLAGYDSVDEFVEHLVSIDNVLRATRKSMNVPSVSYVRGMSERVDANKKLTNERFREFVGLDDIEKQIDELASYMSPREVQAQAQPRTIGADRTAIDRMLGRNKPEQPQVKSDPYGDGHFDDADIDALIAKRQSAVTLADEHFPTIERKPVNLDEYTPVSSKTTEKVKDAETGWQAFRRQFDSDVHGVKTIERELVKNDTKNILKINNIGSVVYEDSLEKGVRGLQKTVARAEKSAKNSYNPIIERVSKAGISKKELEQYTSAMHFRDIYKNNMDKVARRGEILEELEHLDRQFSESPPKKLLDKYTNKADAEKEWKQSLEKRERELVKEFEQVEEYVLPEGATEEWVNYTISKWQNNPTMAQAQKDFIAEQQVDLRMREQAGTYSEAQIEAMLEAHPNYISMRRDIPDNVTGVGSSRSVGRKDILKRKDGSELEILSPVDSAYRNRMMAVINSERTEVINRIGKMLEIEGAENYFRKVPEPNQNTLRGFENGQPVYYEVPPTLVNLYRNLDKTSEKSVLKAIQGLATLQKKMTTNLNVGFHLFSGVRDPIQALGNSRTQAHIGHTVLGYLDSFMGKNLEKMTGGAFKSYRDVYMNLGNERSTLIGMDRHSLQKMSKAIEEGKFADGSSVLNPIKAIEGFGMRVEHGPRLAEFRSAKRKGLSDTDAAFEAADIIDYSDMGSFVREANKYIPYLNPTLRGNIRTFQALKNNPKQFATVGLMNVTLPTVALYALRYADTTNDVQRDKISNLQPWQKNLLWAIPIPNTDKLAFFPKPFIFGQIFASPVERTLDKVFGNTNKSSAELIKESGLDMLSVLSVPYEVAGLMSGFEVLANYDLFSQMPIEDRAMQNESDVSERHNVYTSELAKLIGKAGVSPAKVDHLLKNMAGTLGRDGLDVIDNLLSEVSEDVPAKVNPIMQTLDPTKRFQHRDTQASGQYGEIMEQASADDRKQKEELDWLKSMGIKSTTKMETPAQQMYAANKELNDQIKEVRESKTLTSKEKQKQIARLRAEQRKIGTKFITE